MIEYLRNEFTKKVNVQEKGPFYGRRPCSFENFVELSRDRYGVLVVKKFIEEKEFSRGDPHQVCRKCKQQSDTAPYHTMLPNYVDLQPSLCKCCSPVCCRLFDRGGPKEPGPLLWLEEGGTKFSKELLKT